MTSLQDAYTKTIYRVYLKDEYVDIKVGKKNKKIDHILVNRGYSFLIIITAENPLSKQTETEINKMRMTKLKKDLDKKYCYKTKHIDPEGLWPEECGYAFLDNGIDYALDLAEKYNQNAIVTYHYEHGAELKYTKEYND